MPISSISDQQVPVVVERRRVAVVTGASRGLGRGISVALARSGCDVVVNYNRDQTAAKQTAIAVEDLGATATVVQGDVSDGHTASELVAAAHALGGLDVWVNNAGVSILAPVVDTPATEMARMLEVNIMGTFHGLRAAAEDMARRDVTGRIINVASEVAVQAFRLLGGYSATKFAVVGLTQAAALELGAAGITVNAVGPGTAETDMVTAERRSESALRSTTAEVVRDSYLDAIPLGRFCDPGEVGSLVAWLAGPHASYITGQTFLVNGGAVLH